MAVKKTLQFFLQPLLKKFFQDMGRDPNNLEMILIKQKAGQLLKDSNKIINFPQKRSFKEEIEAMKKSGDLVDEKDMVISEKITNREMFKDANKRFNTKDIDDAIDNASPGFAGDRKYDAQLVADDLAEKRFGKEFYDLDEIDQMELYDEAYQGLTNKKFDPPEDMAQGGIVGLRI